MNRAPETLYIKDNTGAIRVWTIGVLDWRIVMQYGQLNGALQTRFEDISDGKAGRTREQQIISRMQSRIKKQTDSGYSFDIEDAASRPVNALGLKKPMLAQALSKIKNINLTNAYVQPKFDGNRCIITKQQGRMLAYSRNGKIIAANLDHIFIGLDLDDGDYVDLAAQDVAVEGVMDTIITKNIFHNNGNDLVAKVNARILDYKSTDVMDV